MNTRCISRATRGATVSGLFRSATYSRGCAMQPGRNAGRSTVPPVGSARKRKRKDNSGSVGIQIDAETYKFSGANGIEFIVDAADADFVSSKCWTTAAVKRNGSFQIFGWCPDHKRQVALARQLMKPPKGYFVDHINGNTLDNRRSNLRNCTRSENSRNCAAQNREMWSKYKGVTRAKFGKWKATIRRDGSLRHIGTFEDEVSAALAYDAAARKHYGEFACLNFPMNGEQSAHRKTTKIESIISDN